MSSHQLFVLELPWPSRSGNRHVRHAGGRHYLTPEALEYRRLVRRAAEAAKLADQWVGSMMVLSWALCPPDGRARDQTNVLKVVEDAIVRAGVIADDSNRVVVETRVTWVPPEKPGFVFIEATKYITPRALS